VTLVNTMTVETLHTSHQRLPREARVLIAARAVDRLGGFTMGFLPVLLVASYGASLRSAGLVAAGFGLATIPSRLLGGRLGEALGSRTTIVVGLTGCAVAQLGLAVAPDLAAAATAAVLLGLCFEVYEPPSQALLAEVTAPQARVAAYSALGAAIAAAGVVAGLLAALLAGVGLRWLFVADAATCLSCAVMVRSGLPAGRRRHDRARAANPWRDRRLLAMLASGTVFAVVYLVMLTGLPLALRSGGVPIGWSGALLAVGAVTVVSGQWVRSRLPGLGATPFARLRGGYLLLALGLGLAAVVAVLHPSGPAYVLPVVVWSLGSLVLLGEPFAVVADLVAAPDRGRYLAAYGVSWGLATTVAPVVATTLLSLGAAGAMWSGCALVAAALALAQDRVGAVVTQQ
jgi:MFS family permease